MVDASVYYSILFVDVSDGIQLLVQVKQEDSFFFNPIYVH